ncbi:hypothetical protein K4F52_003227 [Lecanicillium sp. MT-2017a]|nr:hypothetical protein K4F52_003227 [Lecanicillium sp. MT-2017a]
MSEPLIQRPWSPQTLPGEVNYFDLPLQALSSVSPLFFINVATPVSKKVIEAPRYQPWRRLNPDGATTPAPSPAHSAPAQPNAATPSDQNLIASYGVDPPRPPRDGYE